MMHVYMIHVYTYTFERVNFRYTGADIGMISRYDLKCIRVRRANDWRPTYYVVSLTGKEIISYLCCSTMPRPKPCLNTSISVTLDVQSNASVCFHPHCGSVVCVKSVSQGMQMAYQQGEMAYGVEKSSVNVEDSWGFCRSKGHLLVWPNAKSCGKRDVLPTVGWILEGWLLPWGWCSYGHTSSLRGSERSSPVLNGFVRIWPGPQVSEITDRIGNDN